MKRFKVFIMLVFAAILTVPAIAQDKLNDEDIFYVVEDMPEFPGGNDALRSYIANNIKYPAEAKKNNIEGKVFVSFVVAKDGSVRSALIERGVAPSIDKEALSVINSMPNWKPGKQRGQAVNVKYTVPINFKLDGENSDVENTEDEEVMIFRAVEDMPEFPGGEKALWNYFAENVQYPKSAQENKVQGKVFVSFVIAKDGSVQNAKVVRSVNPAIDKEALRVINSMPKWTPGAQRGTKVNVQFTMPINFELGEEK